MGGRGREGEEREHTQASMYDRDRVFAQFLCLTWYFFFSADQILSKSNVSKFFSRGSNRYSIHIIFLSTPLLLGYHCLPLFLDPALGPWYRHLLLSYEPTHRASYRPVLVPGGRSVLILAFMLLSCRKIATGSILLVFLSGGAHWTLLRLCMSRCLLTMRERGHALYSFGDTRCREPGVVCLPSQSMDLGIA